MNKSPLLFLVTSFCISFANAGEAILSTDDASRADAIQYFTDELQFNGCENVKVNNCQTIKGVLMSTSDGWSLNGDFHQCEVKSSNCSFGCKAIQGGHDKYEIISIGGHGAPWFITENFFLTGDDGKVLSDNAAPGTGSYICKAK